MENIEKNKAINILVPKLINKTEKLQKEIKRRILSNKIFSEFENKASHKFNRFITNSFKRYNCTKLGNNINNYLSETQREKNYEINKILNSDFYKDNEIKLEKNKMKYKSTTKLIKDINEIFDKIKYPLDTKFSRNSKMKIKEIINEQEIKIKKTENITKKVEFKQIIPIKRNIVNHYNIQSLTTDKNVINAELEKDQKSINNSINDYLDRINNRNIKGDINNRVSPLILLNSGSYSTKPKINFPKIKFLSYSKQKTSIEPKIIKKVIQKSPDIKKILPYYKLFKKKQKKEIIIKEDKIIPFITEVGIKVNNSNKDYDYNDTQDIVYNTASNELNIKQNLEEKRKKFEDVFGLNNIPEITTYKKIIKQKAEKEKMKNMKNAKSVVVINIRDKYNEIINNEMKKLDKLQEELLSKTRKK